jgi:hypothetical protein
VCSFRDRTIDVGLVVLGFDVVDRVDFAAWNLMAAVFWSEPPEHQLVEYGSHPRCRPDQWGCVEPDLPGWYWRTRKAPLVTRLSGGVLTE